MMPRSDRVSPETAQSGSREQTGTTNDEKDASETAILPSGMRSALMVGVLMTEISDWNRGW